MLEEIGRLRQHTTCVEEFSVCESIEVDQKFLTCETSDCPEELPAKLTANDRANLEHTSGLVRQTVDPGHEDFFDRVRDRQRRCLGLEPPAAVVPLYGTCLLKGLHQFLKKERYPFRFFHAE